MSLFLTPVIGIESSLVIVGVINIGSRFSTLVTESFSIETVSIAVDAADRRVTTVYSFRLVGSRCLSGHYVAIAIRVSAAIAIVASATVAS